MFLLENKKLKITYQKLKPYKLVFSLLTEQKNKIANPSFKETVPSMAVLSLNLLYNSCIVFISNIFPKVSV